MARALPDRLRDLEPGESLWLETNDPPTTMRRAAAAADRLSIPVRQEVFVAVRPTRPRRLAELVRITRTEEEE